jgi:hypothetical protein
LLIAILLRGRSRPKKQSAYFIQDVGHQAQYDEKLHRFTFLLIGGKDNVFGINLVALLVNQMITTFP